MQLWDGIIDVNQIPSIPPPKKKDVWIMRGLILVGSISLLYFLFWFFDGDYIGNPFLYWSLAIAVAFKLLRAIHEWYHYAGVSVPEKPELTREYTVDMFTTFVPGEPYDMILDTLQAMVKVRYPHTTYLCDEGNDPYLKQVCEELGVVHVYRGTDKKNAKAGNINYALQQATGEIAVVLDPDHKPAESFLDRVLPYFETKDIGYVQSVQAYHNRDESFIAKGAAEQTYHFYGPMMMSMNRYGTVQAIGANCAFRREALDSIGGHAAGLSEDMHTAMQLHAKGWKSIYVPEALTRGQVPATLAAYYQQQLKWTRGSLDLLFHTVPKLLKHFTWAQALHYLTLPLYFLFGIVAAIDLSIPIISLFTSEVPWLVEMDDLLLHALPLLSMILIIRQFAQRWLLEVHERGVHFLGGTLMIGTWWIFLIGFVYTVIGKKVPYIPTPKNDVARNELKLSTPNIAVILLSLVAIVYGLAKDWSPYMLMMAGFALVNVVMLGLVVLMGQQKMIMGFYKWLYGGVLDPVRVKWYLFRQNFIYRPLRSAYMALGVIIALIFGIIALPALTKIELSDLKPPQVKESEGHYLGLPLASFANLPQAQVVTVNLPANVGEWPQVLPVMAKLGQQQRIPLLVWEPWLTDSLHKPITYQAIAEGEWDEVLKPLLGQANRLGLPVYWLFGPAPDRQDSIWQTTPGNEPKAYGQAWTHIRSMATDQGWYNLVFFFQAFGTPTLFGYLPEERIDILALSAAPHDSTELPFDQRLNLFSRLLRESPTWIMDIQPSDTIEAFLAHLDRLLPEAQGFVFSDEQALPPAKWAAWLRNKKLAPAIMPPDRNGEEKTHMVQVGNEATPKVTLDQQSGMQLLVNGEPFYIKGLAYNPSHDWRDGFYPLTRQVLEEDFQQVKDLGANTIRRYSPGIYDYNLLKVAHEHDIKVLYGFWFDPEVDYYRDPAQVKKYKREVIARVKELKDRDAILAWGIGNETWGLLKHHFRRTYLPTVRMAYLRMIEDIAREIHAIDPNHPVFAACEHSPDLALALASYQEQVPSLDFMAVNSYFEEQISQLDRLCTQFFPDKPYLVSEFGPEGYWDLEYAEFNSLGQSKEPSSYEKAASYNHHWLHHVAPHADHNLGGVAFCWRDRMEETVTWFGLTDSKGRIRPGYMALQAAWRGDSTYTFPVPDLYFPQASYPFGGFLLKATTALDSLDDFQVEWFVREDHILEPVEGLEAYPGTLKAWVEGSVLKHGQEYRAYVSLIDSTGRFATSASLPLYFPE